MTHAILGGGISGLSAAYYLSKTIPNTIKLYESSNRLGGWIRSTQSENGALFELGPRYVGSRGRSAQSALRIIKELEMNSLVKVLLSDSKVSKSKLIYLNNQLLRVPDNAEGFFKINPPFVRPFIHAVIKDFSTPPKKVKDDNVHDFACRRFGEDYADILFSAMASAMYAGDSKKISADAVVHGIFQSEQKHGTALMGFVKSIFRAKKKTKTPQSDNIPTAGWHVWSLKDGLETLPKHLKEYLNTKTNVKIALEHKCTSVAFENGKVLLKVNGVTETADRLYATLSSKHLASILGDEHSSLKTILSSIPFVSVAVVNLEYEGDVINQKGFGVLVPPNQNLQILGILFDSCIFPQEGKTVITVMMGGHWFKEHFGEDPDENSLLAIAESHVKKMLNIYEKPIGKLVTVLKDCMPQYVVGHYETIETARNYISQHKLPLTIIGQSYDGIGVAPAIYSANKEVWNVVENLKQNSSNKVLEKVV